MRFYSRCENCKRKAFFVRKRKYNIKAAGIINSQNELCGRCYRNIKVMLKGQLI